MEYQYLNHINLGSILEGANDLIECFRSPGILILSTLFHETNLLILNDGTIKEFEYFDDACAFAAKYLAGLEAFIPESLMLGLIKSATDGDEDGMYDIVENEGGQMMLSQTINIENLISEAQESLKKSELVNVPFCLVQFTDSASTEIIDTKIVIDSEEIDIFDITVLASHMGSLDYSVCLYLK
jgi:hypothetical protein